MTHIVDGSDSGIFILTDSTMLTPAGDSNFKIGDSVNINYIEHQKAIVIDESIGITNPYTEIWTVHHVELKQQPIVKKAEINYNIDTRFDRDFLDLMLWALVILTTFWELSIIFKLIRN